MLKWNKREHFNEFSLSTEEFLGHICWTVAGRNCSVFVEELCVCVKKEAGVYVCGRAANVRSCVMLYKHKKNQVIWILCGVCWFLFFDER